MDYDFDAIIVGGGPGGATAALVAGRLGLRVLLLDAARFPRDKICGDAIPFRALALAEELGLGEALQSVPHARAGGLSMFTRDERLRVPYAPRRLLVCRRAHFDAVLFRAAASVVEAREEHRVTGLLRTPSGQVCGVAGEAAGGAFSHTARVVVGADGFKSIVARELGVYARAPEHWAVATRVYYRGVSLPAFDTEIHYLNPGRPDYLWIFPVDADTVNVGVGRIVGRGPARPSLRALHEQLVAGPALARRFARARPTSDLRGWNLPLASRRRVVHGDGFLLVGDAAGLVDPAYGHGVDTAMISGQLAATVLAEVCRGSDYGAGALAAYADGVWAQLGPGFEEAMAIRACFGEVDPVDPVDPVEGTEPWRPLARLNAALFAGAGELARVQKPGAT